MTYRRIAGLVLSLLAVIGADSFGQTQVSGNVVSRLGVPEQGATVQFYPYGPFHGLAMAALTDKDGHFVIPVVYQGAGLLSASRVQEGFPDAAVAFFSPKDFQSIKEIDTSNGSKEGLLLTFGEPLPRIVLSFSSSKGDASNFRIKVSSDARPNVYSTFSRSPSETWTFVVPPDPVTITVVADDYKAWVFNTSAIKKTGGEVIRLTAGLK